MASTLITSYPAFGTLQIGDWTPNNFTETNVDIVPVKSMDGRNVAYSEITINIHARFVGDVGVAALQLAYAIPSMWVDTPSPGPASRSVATPRH